MKTLLVYLLQMIASAGLLYGYYYFFLRNKKFHRYNRFYLLAVVLISLVIPFFNIPVYFTKEATDNSVLLQTLNAINFIGTEEPVNVIPVSVQSSSPYGVFNWQNIASVLYALIVIAFLIRVFLSVRKIKVIAASYPTEKIGDIKFVNTNEPGTPFSYFRWLFWNNEIELDSDKGQQIFRHELFHINQKHTLDVFFMELVTAIAWFNPFFHLIKKELKTIHEFLADEYAMHKSESWQYAELLLMQALNTKLHLVNPFFHNQIKRRIAMITTSQKPGHQYLRKLLVLPVAAIIAALFAFSYKNRVKDDSIIKSNKQITIVVDASHGGIDAGAKSPDGKYTEAQMVLEISKTIQNLAKDYNIDVVMTREKDELPGGASTKEQGLINRLAITNKTKPDAFISIHINAAGQFEFQEKYSGIEAYMTGAKNELGSKTLIAGMLQNLSTLYKTDQQIKQRDTKGIYVLDNNNYPAALIELGYMNNLKDLAYFNDKTNQEKIAKAILNSVSQFANSYSTILQDNIVDTPKTKLPTVSQWNRSSNQPERKSPTAGQLSQWQDEKEYGVWIDTRKIKNNELAKHKASDFTYYNVSKLYGTAKKNVAYNYQVNLFTKNSDMDKLIEKAQKDWRDSTKMVLVVNNTIYSKAKIEDIDKSYPPNTIERINVLKGKDAISKYGEIGKYGVIELTTKSPTIIKYAEVELVDTAPLVIVDGKDFGRIQIKKIDAELSPNDIESIVVLKSPNSVEKYGEKGKYGVIEIYTKEYIEKHPEIKEEREEQYKKYNKNNNPPLPEVVVTGFPKSNSKPSDNAIPVFEKVEVEPSFPGGTDAWRKYLEKNLNALVPVNNGAKEGTYKVQIKFLVDKEGDISSIKALTHHGFGMEEEVIRVIAKGPKWVPAKQNGQIVNAYKTQPVTFMIAEEVNKQPMITSKN